MKNFVIFILFLGVAHSQDADQHKVKLPPCGACNTVVNSFLNYAKKETNFANILAKTCSDVTRGKEQCRENMKNWSGLLKKWFEDQKEFPTLKNWLCIDTLEFCCPELHFGSHCKPCENRGENGKICSGNGKCKGAGTRKGNGACQCDPGFSGEVCQTCSDSYYLSYQDEHKTLCSPCHNSCLGQCTGAGPKKCMACKSGFIMHAEEGCQDIDECKLSPKCESNQFCHNFGGGYRCLNCDKACKKCHNEGPENCVECADGYMRSGNDRVCVKDESGKVLSISNARYFTYGGLCIATAIIFQRSTLIAGALGVFIGVYIPFAEYYLQNMDGELQPFVKQ